MLKGEEEKFTREHQQDPKTDQVISGDLCQKDEVMIEEKQKSKGLIVGGDAPNLMAVSQLLP